VTGSGQESIPFKLIESWIAEVRSRPNGMCGIFLDADDGQPNGPRARPWDEPDLLVSATLDVSMLRLRFDRYGAVCDVEIADITGVEPVQHSWGAGLLVCGSMGHTATQIVLV